MRAMTPRELLPGEWAVLGLLLLRPMHGYEMARSFERDGLSEVCPVEQSLLYTYLRNLEERALVTWREQRVGLRPPRKTYQLTESGSAAVAAWLNGPVARIREVRLDLLLKLYFLHRLNPEGELALLGEQVRVCEAYRERLVRRVGASDGFARLVATSKLTAADATLSWLRAYAFELEHAPGAPLELAR